MRVKSVKKFHPVRYIRQAAVAGMMALASYGAPLLTGATLKAQTAAAPNEQTGKQAALLKKISEIERQKPARLVVDSDTGSTLLTAALLADKTALNDYLVTATRNNIVAARHAGRTAYSVYLDSLENDINARIARRAGAGIEGPFNAAYIIDPYELDVLIGLQQDARDAVMTMMGMDGRFDLLRRAPLAASAAARDYASRYGDYTYAQYPALAYSLLEGVPQTGIIIPASDQMLMTTYGAMSFDETLAYINMHEGFHAVDPSFAVFNNAGKAQHNVPYTLGDLKAAPEHIDIYAIFAQRESFADVAAAGEMIRNGHRLSLIDDIAAMRLQTPDNGIHMSTLVLRQLERQIKRKGIDNFRRMDETAALKLYTKLVRKYGVTPLSLRTTFAHDSADKKQQRRLSRRAIFNRQVRTGLRFAAITGTPENTPVPAFFRLLTPAESAVAGALRSWSARQTLLNEAFNTAGIITPMSLIKAHATLQDSLAAVIRRDPAEQNLYMAQKLRLKTFFAAALSRLDYATENENRGVPLTRLLSAGINPSGSLRTQQMEKLTQ